MTKPTLITAVLICFGISALTAQADSLQLAEQERNKALALSFYNDLWANNTTELYTKYMADTYIAQVERVKMIIKKRQSNIQLLSVNYHDALENPESMVNRLNDFFGGALDTKAMLNAVDPALHRQKIA